MNSAHGRTKIRQQGLAPLDTMQSTILTLAMLALAFPLACGPEPGIPIEGRELTVACASCIFEMPGVEGCPWAAEVDGRHYLLRGRVPQDHLSHEPDGICNMERRARIDGEIRGELLHVSQMTLLDAEDIPAKPRYSPEDAH
jgi:hypothetical protein